MGAGAAASQQVFNFIGGVCGTVDAVELRGKACRRFTEPRGCKHFAHRVDDGIRRRIARQRAADAPGFHRRGVDRLVRAAAPVTTTIGRLFFKARMSVP